MWPNEGPFDHRKREDDKMPLRPAGSPPLMDGIPGKAILRLDGTIRWWICVVTSYAVAMMGFGIFILRQPSPQVGVRVLPSAGLKVDQFLSGLVLSVVLTPAAIMVRKVASELALYYPCAISSRKPVRLSDLDRLRDGGLGSVFHLLRYSPATAATQTLLILVGAILVPVGTLLVFPGTFAPYAEGFQTVGMPTVTKISTSNMSMFDSMDMLFFERGQRDWTSSNDLVNNYTMQALIGILSQSGGALSDTPSQIGPVSTVNLTFNEGVRYDGIPTFNWTSGCVSARHDIPWTPYADPESHEFMHNFTFPDGYVASTLLDDGGGTSLMVNETAANKTSLNGPGMIPDFNNYTVYYVVLGDDNITSNVDVTKDENSDFFERRSINYEGNPWRLWAARVACKPKFNWEMSSCVWDGSKWTSCTPLPHSNRTTLDTVALDTLAFYMTSLLHSADVNDAISGLAPIPYALQYGNRGRAEFKADRAPVLADWEKLYGTLAQAIVHTATSGYYGTAEVATRGAPPQPAYLVREAVLALLLVMLVGCPLAASLWLLRAALRGEPLRQTTILTTASAMRGPGWDEWFYGTCAASRPLLEDKADGVAVRYGVERGNPGHVGFAEYVDPIKKEQRYFGVGRMAV